MSFLWDPKHGVYAAAAFSANVTLWSSRNDTQILTSVIMNIINMGYTQQRHFQQM